MVVGVFFGGKSCEHDISVITGVRAIEVCRHKCVAVFIDRDGVWYTGEVHSINDVRRRKGFKRVHMRPNEKWLYHNNKRLVSLDAALLCLHGLNGEDGTVQGLLEICGLPYTSSGVLGSAISIDKPIAKTLFAAAGLKTTEFITIERGDYNADVYECVKRVKQSLGFPLICKPARLGSSIGVNIARSWDAFFVALRVAFEWDNTVIIERALENFTEINCAVLKCGSDYLVSETEEPTGWKEFLKFQDKYGKSLKNFKRKCPASAPPEIIERVKADAVKAFNAVGADGVARVDFMLCGEELYVNEINTIPGSLAAPLFTPLKISESELIDRLINGALESAKNRARLKYDYKSDIITITK